MRQKIIPWLVAAVLLLIFSSCSKLFPNATQIPPIHHHKGGGAAMSMATERINLPQFTLPPLPNSLTSFISRNNSTTSLP